MRNLLSFDVEDWYQGLAIAPARWGEFAPRLTIGMEVILDLLARHGTHATFFVLGVVAQENPAHASRSCTPSRSTAVNASALSARLMRTPPARSAAINLIMRSSIGVLRFYA